MMLREKGRGKIFNFIFLGKFILPVNRGFDLCQMNSTVLSVSMSARMQSLPTAVTNSTVKDVLSGVPPVLTAEIDLFLSTFQFRSGELLETKRSTASCVGEK
eukprot:sb/3478428/